MVGKLSFMLLLVASPGFAAQAASDIKIDENGQAYKIKKVCRTVEVAGSFIPRQNCTTKKIPITKPAPESREVSASGDARENETAKVSEEQ